MAMNCILSCHSMKQEVEFSLSDHLMDMSSVDFSKCTAVYEDGNYDIYFQCDQYGKNEIERVGVCVNGEQVGSISLRDDTDVVEGFTKYNDTFFTKQPFLLHYDLVVVSFVIFFTDGSSQEFFTDFLLCMSKSWEDTVNIQKMLKELIAFDDSQVNEWIFNNSNQKTENSLYEGKWNKRAYRSLGSYIQLVEQVVTCYKTNFAYFKTQGKHTIKQSEVLVSYEKVKRVSRDNFNWIMKNADQLTNVSHMSGIQYRGKNYLPYHVRTDSNTKSLDVYENRIIICFLYTVLLNAEQIYSEFDKDILNEERIIAKIHGGCPKEYCAPIITVKSLHISFCKTLLGQLRRLIDVLQNIYNKYFTLFNFQTVVIATLPRKTSTFCEIKPYMQVFELIVRWFQYGEYSLEKERLILQVKTLDKLFEYYCLLRLLKMLADNGYQKASVKDPVFKFNYTAVDEHYRNEKDVANTYVLSNGYILATLYYQPVISSYCFENGITLYRTTTQKGYYTPDFILKFASSDQDEEYVILDAKFSSRKSIHNHHLPEVIRKYSCEIGVAAKVKFPKMVWVLQGRVKSSENAIWKYHNSPLSDKYQPITSYGVVSVNTAIEIRQQLWNEIRKNISFLK